MEWMLLIALFGLLTGAISYAGYRVYLRPAQVLARIQQAPPGLGSGAAPRRERRAARVVAVQWLESLGRRLHRPGSAANGMQERLNNAGYRRESDLAVFLAARLIAAGATACGVVFATVGLNLAAPYNLLVPAFGVVIGWIVPGIVLDRLAKRRKTTLRMALPDALDLLTVCVEAGLGFDQALLRVCEQLQSSYPQLSYELSLVNLEMNAGKRRAEALRHLADRTGVDEIAKFASVLIQSDRFGTSLAESLRTHSDYLRIRRRQEAEERANKVGVKLVFPIFFCILPSMMVVVAGPGLLQVMQQMIPLMQQFNAR